MSKVLGSVSNVQSSVTDIKKVTDTMDWQKVTALSQQSTTILQDLNKIDWNQVTALQTMTAQSFAQINSELSKLSDAATAINQASVSSSDAAKQAREAKSLISSLQGSLSTLQSAVGNGDQENAMSALSDIKQTLTALKSSAGEAQAKFDPLLLFNQMQDMAKVINEFAKKKGLEPLVTIDAEALMAKTTANEANVNLLNNKVEELRAMIEVVRALADKAANEPIVTDWYESQ